MTCTFSKGFVFLTGTLSLIFLISCSGNVENVTGVSPQTTAVAMPAPSIHINPVNYPLEQSDPVACVINGPLLLQSWNYGVPNGYGFIYSIKITTLGTTIPSDWQYSAGPSVSGVCDAASSAQINDGTFDLKAFALSKGITFASGNYYRISMTYGTNGTGSFTGFRLLKFIAPTTPVETQSSAAAINFTTSDWVADRGKTNVASFNGTNYQQIPNSASINFGTGDFSVSVWVKTSVTTTQTILDKRDPSTDIGYHMVIYSGVVLFQVHGPSGYLNYYNLTSKKINDGQWHHIVVTIDRDNTTGGKIYVDNTLQHTFDPRLSFGSVSNTAPLYIGRHKDGAYFIGRIDDFRLYNQSLAAGEVSYLFSN